MKKIIKTNLTLKEMEESIPANQSFVGMDDKSMNVFMELDTSTFLDQHEDNVKKNMKNLMDFMRK